MLAKLETDPDCRFLDSTIASLQKNLPPLFARSQVPKLLGGAISAGTLANLGKSGPPYLFFNRRVVYERNAFINWLISRIKTSN